MQFAFGAGNMYVTQLNDAWGNPITNPTPYPLMALQEGSVDLSGDVKELFGQNQLPVAVGRGKMKLTVKVKPARIFSAVWNAIFFGQTLNQGLIANYTDNVGELVPPASVGGVTAITIVSGGTSYVQGDIVTVSTGTSTVKAQAVVTAVSAGVVTGLTIINAGSYTVAPTASGATTGGTGSGLTVTCTATPSSVIVNAPYSGVGTAFNMGTYAADMGCTYAATGMPLKRVASAPTTGQYSVNTTTGVYTFAAADAGLTIYINFQYTNYSSLLSAGYQTVQNLPMGYAPSFKADLTVAYLGKMTTFSFNKAIATKMNMNFKNEDFAVPEFDFSAFDDGSGNVMKWSTSE